MAENTAMAAGRFRDTGLFVLLTVWMIAIAAAGYLLNGVQMDTAYWYLVSAGFEILLFAPAAVFIAAKRIRLAGLFGRANAAQIVSAAFLGMLIVPVSIAISVAVNFLVTLTGGRMPEAGIQAPETALQYLAAFAALGIAAPFVEEPIFRGLVLGGQAGAIRRGTAVFMTGLAFALFHGQIIGLPSILVGGVVMTVLAWRSGSLWPPIAAHAAYNSMILLQILMGSLILKGIGAPAAAFVPPFPSPVPPLPSSGMPDQFGMFAGAVVWCFIALPFAAAAGAVLWAFWRYTPSVHRPGLAHGAGLGFAKTWPWIAAFVLLLGYLAIDVLQIYGIIRAIPE